MANVIEDQNQEFIPDTSAHAKPYSVGKYGERRDVLVVPEEGVYLSAHKAHDMERDAQKAYREHNPGSKYDDKSYHKLFISRGQILELAAALKANDQMQDAFEKAKADYEATCYEGTDTEDPLKTKTRIDKRRNEFRLDKSRSTIALHCTSSTGTMLNGSAVEHSHFVSIYIKTPDGRTCVEVSMTFDQLAAMLVSNMETPCTLTDYWSVNESNVRLSEVVHPPEDIRSRMQQRLQQATEELSSIAERVTIEIKNRLRANNTADVHALLSEIKSPITPALPAPDSQAPPN